MSVEKLADKYLTIDERNFQQQKKRIAIVECAKESMYLNYIRTFS